ncbi:unnamed protein product [Albugo candida]|uniref:Uncharacterized protein n=1 Tax=Albugo candida TaxID=65357 RepID=A0A024GAW1_9STRA|nr:unnamed protein product [Albugo candida]|eukprot:CCI43690.1 unnamed protein product [Albugo candida]
MIEELVFGPNFSIVESRYTTYLLIISIGYQDIKSLPDGYQLIGSSKSKTKNSSVRALNNCGRKLEKAPDGWALSCMCILLVAYRWSQILNALLHECLIWPAY